MANSWQGKMCPILSSGVVRVPEESRVLSVDGAAKGPRQEEMTALPCQGPACAWFMHEADAQGRPTAEGACAILFATKGVGETVMFAAAAAQALAQAPDRTNKR